MANYIAVEPLIDRICSFHVSYDSFHPSLFFDIHQMKLIKNKVQSLSILMKHKTNNTIDVLSIYCTVHLFASSQTHSVARDRFCTYTGPQKPVLSHNQLLTPPPTAVCYCGERSALWPGSHVPAASPETPASRWPCKGKQWHHSCASLVLFSLNR